MNTRTLMAVATLLVAPNLIAQRMTAEFEDGTVMEYEVLTNSANDINPFWFSTGSTHGSVRDGMKLEYFREDLGVFQVRLPSVTAMLTSATKPSFHVSGLFFVNENRQQKEMDITLMSTSSGDVITKYRTSTPIDRINRFGVHGGLGIRDTRSSSFGSGEAQVTYAELALGVGMFRSKHIAIMRESNGVAYRAQGTASMQLTADGLLFVGTENTDSTSTELLDANSVGLEVAWVGRASFWGKRDWGIWLTAGAGVGPLTAYPVAGFGLYFGFGNKR